MIEKITPSSIILTVWIGWIMYTTTFEYRKHRFGTMPYMPSPYNSYAREIELSKLGKVYQYKEHLTKSMYQLK